jgi:D-amino-acid oxidase
VIGLSAAIELGRKGLKVVIVAKDLPEDTESVGFASPWAVSTSLHLLLLTDVQGCNWHSFESDSSTRQAVWDRVTFNRLADLASQQSNLCKRIPFMNVWTDQARATQIWFQDLVGDVSVYVSLRWNLAEELSTNISPHQAAYPRIYPLDIHSPPTSSTRPSI